MNEVLIGSLIDKVDAQERKIGLQENQINELREKANHIPDNAEAVHQFKTALEGLRADIKKLAFPEKEMRQMSATLETIKILLLKEPVKKEIIHHYYSTKTIWIAAALFLIVCLISIGWYNTYKSLQMYKP